MFEFEIEHMLLKPHHCKVKLSPVESHHFRTVLCFLFQFGTCVFLTSERIHVNVFLNRHIAYVILYIKEGPRGVDARITPAH